MEAVRADLPAFLQDHAAAEKKASGHALTLVAHYPNRVDLVEALIEVAREELDHYQQVWRVLRSRGLPLGKDGPDPYVRAMARKGVRHGTEAYLLDRLLVAGVIERRGCERFGLVAEGLDDPDLSAFYSKLVSSEARHQAAFVELARRYFPKVQVEQRLEEILDLEGNVAAAQPFRATLH